MFLACWNLSKNISVKESIFSRIFFWKTTKENMFIWKIWEKLYHMIVYISNQSVSEWIVDQVITRSATVFGFKCRFKSLKCKWTHLSSPVLHINHCHHRFIIYICIIRCLLSPDDVLYVVFELISKIKYAVCKLNDEPPRLLGEKLCFLFCFRVQTASLNSEAIRP